MGSSGYISPRPGFRLLTRTDDVQVLVNMHLVRTIEPIVDGVRIAFGPLPGDRIDVKLTSVGQLNDLVALWQIG